MVAENGQKHRSNTAGLKPPWRKGQSGNPGGRPKGRSLLAAIAEELDKLDGKARKQAAKSYVTALKRGSFNHAKELIEREEGRLPEDSNVRVVIVYADGQPGDSADDETATRRAASSN